MNQTIRRAPDYRIEIEENPELTGDVMLAMISGATTALAMRGASYVTIERTPLPGSRYSMIILGWQK